MTTSDPAQVIRPEYPNREHANADRAARRRASKALDAIGAEVETLRRRLASADNPLSSLDEDDTQLITGEVRNLTGELAIIGALRSVREWHKADRADAERKAQHAYRRWLASRGEGGAGAGAAYEGDTDVKDGFLDGFTAGSVGAPWLEGGKK
jgi:hypothetical protein